MTPDQESDQASQALAFLDTSMIARYVTRDVPEPAERARRIIEDHPDLWITPVMIVESAFVLTRNYGVARPVVVDTLILLLRRANIRVYQMDKTDAIQALLLCRPSGRVSFADALLWAIARSSGNSAIVYTLDRRFPADGIDTRQEL